MRTKVVDSSAWLEHLQGTPRARLFLPALARMEEVLVPTLVLYEVHRVLAGKGLEEAADAAFAMMSRARVADLSPEIAWQASHCARAHRLAMADAIIYATAIHHEAELWTQDSHFEGLPGVRFFAKR